MTQHTNFIVHSNGVCVGAAYTPTTLGARHLRRLPPVDFDWDKFLAAERVALYREWDDLSQARYREVCLARFLVTSALIRRAGGFVPE